MSDRKKSIDLDSALRETFVYQLYPDQRKLLRSVCSGVLTLSREARLVYPGDVPITLRDIRAIAFDLRYVEAYLMDMYEDEERWEGRQESRACDLAGGLAPEVGEIAASLEAAADAW